MLEDEIRELSLRIHRNYLKLKADLLESLKKRRITAGVLAQTLLSHSQFHSREKEYFGELFEEHRVNLSSTKEIDEVFEIITDYNSYFNYELIETIIIVHGSDNDKKRLKQYLSDFAEYCKKVPCEEVNDDHAESSPKLTKVKFKLDYEKHKLKCGDIKRIQRQIAKILKIKCTLLKVCQVGEGCIEITFLVPRFIMWHFESLQEDEKSALIRDIRMISVTPLVS